MQNIKGSEPWVVFWQKLDTSKFWQGVHLYITISLSKLNTKGSQDMNGDLWAMYETYEQLVVNCEIRNMPNQHANHLDLHFDSPKWGVPTSLERFFTVIINLMPFFSRLDGGWVGNLHKTLTKKPQILKKPKNGCEQYIFPKVYLFIYI